LVVKASFIARAFIIGFLAVMPEPVTALLIISRV
jgi:hypothetical protein